MEGTPLSPFWDPELLSNPSPTVDVHVYDKAGQSLIPTVTNSAETRYRETPATSLIPWNPSTGPITERMFDDKVQSLPTLAQHVAGSIAARPSGDSMYPPRQRKL